MLGTKPQNIIYFTIMNKNKKKKKEKKNIPSFCKYYISKLNVNVKLNHSCSYRRNQILAALGLALYDEPQQYQIPAEMYEIH